MNIYKLNASNGVWIPVAELRTMRIEIGNTRFTLTEESGKLDINKTHAMAQDRIRITPLASNHIEVE